MAGFKATAAVMDRGVGQVLGALDAAGLAENTLVISTTDHGIAFPAMKCNLTDHGMGVMLIMRGPGGFRGGKVVRRHGLPHRPLPDRLRPGRTSHPPDGWKGGRSCCR